MQSDVLKYFKILASIPRNSGHEEKVAQYLLEFAKQHNLKAVKDKNNNVLITKQGSKPISLILQSHLDMVCVKEPDIDFDFLTQPLNLKIEGDYLFAQGTSLGADNGIGVAIILSLLADNSIDVSFQALFTTDEEVTMTGAINFDYSQLKASNLISLDGMSEDELIDGCASICDMKLHFKPNFCVCPIQNAYSLTIKGLKGGHSGNDINSNLGNAINIASCILGVLSNVKLSQFSAGNQFNFIPNYAQVVFSCSEKLKTIKFMCEVQKKLYKDLQIDLSTIEATNFLGEEDSKKILNVLTNLPTGVIKKDKYKNIVLSQNLAGISLNDGLIKVSQRGHDVEVEDKNIEKIKLLAQNNNCDFEIYDKQVGFKTNDSSALIENICKVYKKTLNKDLKIINKHISLEAAIFKQKLPNLNVAIISPTLLNVHSTSERAYLPSVENIYNVVKNLLTTVY